MRVTILAFIVLGLLGGGFYLFDGFGLWQNLEQNKKENPFRLSQSEISKIRTQCVSKGMKEEYCSCMARKQSKEYERLAAMIFDTFGGNYEDVVRDINGRMKNAKDRIGEGCRARLEVPDVVEMKDEFNQYCQDNIGSGQRAFGALAGQGDFTQFCTCSTDFAATNYEKHGLHKMQKLAENSNIDTTRASMDKLKADYLIEANKVCSSFLP